MDTILITEEGLLVFYHWLASQGAGVAIQGLGYLIVKGYKNSQGKTMISWRNPMSEKGDKVDQFYEFITELVFIAALLVYLLNWFTYNEFAHNISNLWGESPLLMTIVTIGGIISEIRPSWEKQINKHTIKGVVWIGLLLLFSAIA